MNSLPLICTVAVLSLHKGFGEDEMLCRHVSFFLHISTIFQWTYSLLLLLSYLLFLFNEKYILLLRFEITPAAKNTSWIVSGNNFGVYTQKFSLRLRENCHRNEN
jgi:hypothetical protein